MEGISITLSRDEDQMRTLEVQPLLGEVGLLGTGLEADFALGVVLLDEVLDDGTRFPQCEVGVWVYDCGHAAVGVELGEGFALDVGELDIVQVVWDAELFSDHADLGGVGAMLAVDLDGLDGHVCGWKC
jgi:hypothetical protein